RFNASRLTLASACLGTAALTLGCLTFLAADATAGGHTTSQARGGTPAYLCSAVITVEFDNGTTETYQKQFQLAAGQNFEDDFSTATRAHIFDASATAQGDTITFDFDYFSDTSALSTVDLGTSLTLRSDQKIEGTAGRHQFYHSLSGAYTVDYTFTCTRK
ncbi:MAG: hypothetical protein KDA21_13385, partial [Phycisphaerales bacterium]|nr:hypothetical protein [Phycisphaerales bacterium]